MTDIKYEKVKKIGVLSKSASPFGNLRQVDTPRCALHESMRPGNIALTINSCTRN